EDVKTELAAPRDESALTEVRRDDPPLTTPTLLAFKEIFKAGLDMGSTTVKLSILNQAQL
ncbi:MAG: hypothetical protein LE168_04525, partial [Endomicrobium sp.]|nr:hypothetical protein [Endomicrobium sp.]